MRRSFHPEGSQGLPCLEAGLGGSYFSWNYGQTLAKTQTPMGRNEAANHCGSGHLLTPADQEIQSDPCCYPDTFLLPHPFTQSGTMAHGTVSPTVRVSSSPVETPSQTHSEWSPVGGSKRSRVGSEDGRAITASVEHRGKGRLSLDHRWKRCIQACSVCSGRC